MNERGLFITGTDTDIGKTVAAAAVLTQMRNRGIDAAPMKPIQTGASVREGSLESPDLQFCLHLAGMKPDSDDCKLMAPYLFEPACSPHLASALSGREISLTRIADAVAVLLEKYELVIIEGAGGVLVPITPAETMLDLMVLLGFRVILVARPGLGTINHTLLSLRELERSGISAQGILFCESQPTTWGEIENDNWKTIERMGRTPVLGRIPFMRGLTEGKISPMDFRRLSTEHFHLP